MITFFLHDNTCKISTYLIGEDFNPAVTISLKLSKGWNCLENSIYPKKQWNFLPIKSEAIKIEMRK